MSKILDGKKLSGHLALGLTKKIKKLTVKPKLVIIQIGDLKQSNTYIKNKKVFAEKIGAIVEHKKYPKNVKESSVISNILKYNRDTRTHGIIVQLPTPKHFNIEKVLESIDPKKDVDGLTSTNIKYLFINKKTFIPATTRGILALLESYKINLKETRVVIVGRSSLVGKPTALALLNRDATVTVCHSNTINLEKETGRAHILIIAVGHPKFIGRKYVSKNQVVIDVGINITKNKKIVGDVDFDVVKKIVRAITPVPGGVGPMTVVSLFQNLLEAYSLQTQK